MKSFQSHDPSGQRGASPPSWLVHGLLLLLVSAIITNGLHFWLLRTEVLQSSAFADYLNMLRARDDGRLAGPVQNLLESFYQTPGAWIFTKLLKDVFVFAFALVSAWYLRPLLAMVSSNSNPVRSLGIPALFGASVVIASAGSWLMYGPWVTVAGLRPIAYLLAGAAGWWFFQRRNLDWLTRYLLAVLAIELFMACYEAIYGLPLFTSNRAVNRVVGTFSFPTTLGVFVVCTCVFVRCFSATNPLLLLALVIPLVYLSGSATALVLLLVSIAVLVASNSKSLLRRFVPITLASLLMASFLTMPYLVQRDDIYDSLWGRIEPFEDYLAHLPGSYALFFGKGLGIGSNSLSSLISHENTKSPGSDTRPDNIDLEHARTDSTPLALLNQVGLLGTFFFYLMLLTAARKDHRAAPVYLVLAIAGLAINLLEFFPVNFLLGMLLCRSLLLNQTSRNTLGETSQATDCNQFTSPPG